MQVFLVELSGSPEMVNGKMYEVDSKGVIFTNRDKSFHGIKFLK